MDPIRLFNVRIALVRAFLVERGYDGILLSRADNYAMATGGLRNYVSTGTDAGANSLFISKGGAVCMVGNSVEAPRQMEEELRGLPIQRLEFLWFANTPAEVVRRRFTGSFCSDDGVLGPNVHAALAPLRALLTMDELEKYRRLGALAAEAMQATLDAIAPGMSEAEVAATLVAEGARRRCRVPVALVAADKRIARYRHPLPTERPLLDGAMQERGVFGYAMVVACLQREGLVASVTRFRQVGGLPPGVADAYARICGVDALMQEATVPGQTLGGVFAACQRAYADLGFAADEWHNHHQGGATGYAGRAVKATPEEPLRILDGAWPRRVRDILGSEVDFGMAFAWNPSAPGVKSEDTFILLPDGSKEIVTLTPKLPRVDLEAVIGRRTYAVKSGIAPA